MVDVLVLRAAGTNCDRETVFAFERAGARARPVHINALREDPGILSRHQILAIPGGFTYGDDIAAGAVLALQMRTFLADALRAFADADKLIIGICNGFQVLTRTGLLPRLDGEVKQTVTLAPNDSGRFEDRWVRLVCEADCAFARKGETLYLPVAHAEGKFTAEESVMEELLEREQVVFRYADAEGRPTQRYPDNPNGSLAAIAGVRDGGGRVLGLMPHPERHIFWYHHPFWQRTTDRPNEGDGFRIFRRAVAYFEE